METSRMIKNGKGEGGNGSQPRKASPMRRGALSRTVLVEQSLELLDRDGVDGFSLPKLGRHLGCDQTAVYRHFASKDELVLAVADRLLELAGDDVDTSGCWLSVLEDLGHRLRRVYLEHHAAASLSGYRTTGGPAELRGAERVLSLMISAGFADERAVHQYRCFVDFVLYWCGGEAASLSEKVKLTDLPRWRSSYLVSDPELYPSIRTVRDHLPGVDDDALFDSVLGHVLAGIARDAPTSCSCVEHLGGSEVRSSPAR